MKLTKKELELIELCIKERLNKEIYVWGISDKDILNEYRQLLERIRYELL